jgi:hypothetical protein
VATALGRQGGEDDRVEEEGAGVAVARVHRRQGLVERLRNENAWVTHNVLHASDYRYESRTCLLSCFPSTNS